jgi:dolichol-phosphate mannosyltransferase
MAVMLALFKGAAMELSAAQTVAVPTAIFFNFRVNNLMTYCDRCLAGTARFRGMAPSMLAYGVGALASCGAASYLFGCSGGWVLAAMAGILVGAVGNYAVTSF